MALAAYRSIIRAAKFTFRDDANLLNAALAETRKGFENGKSISSKDPKAEEQVRHALEIAKILRTNVVQGRMEDEDEDEDGGGGGRKYSSFIFNLSDRTEDS